MPRPQKVERNKEMVAKRLTGWTIHRIAKHYRIDYRAAWEILERDLPRYKKELMRLSTGAGLH